MQSAINKKTNCFTEDANATALHITQTPLDEPNSYVGVLFVNFSSAFNTIIPHKLVSKLDNLGLGSSLRAQVMEFQQIVGAESPDLDTVYASRLRRKASSILKDDAHPGHAAFLTTTV